MDVKAFVDSYIAAHSTMERVDDVLAHYAVGYDPQQAHEYYLLNRQLKGRQAAAVKPTSTATTSAKVAPAPVAAKAKAVVAKPATKTKPKSPPKSAAELQVEANVQVKAIEKKLDDLNHKLSSLKQQEKAADAKAALSKKATATKDAKPHTETPAEKAKAHETYEKAKSAGTVKKTAGSHHSLKEQVATVTSQIATTRKQLDTLVAKLRTQTAAKLAKLP